MRISRIRGVGFILWRARHELYHVFLGLMWAWILRERWGQFSWKFVGFSVFGSLIPDIEHFIYWFSYGKSDEYVLQIKNLIRRHQWRVLATFIEKGHKHNTSLSYHNIYFVLGLLTVCTLASIFDLKLGVVVLGAMISHYLFDIVDDYITLGYLNDNWKRWGRKKTSA
jgi:hypothetical protein